MSNQPLDLSGVWHGQFSYPRAGRDPVSFVATLDERAGAVVGDCEEVGAVAEAKGQTLTATLQGRRSDRELTFLKLYDGDNSRYDTVQYEGEVSEDGSEIVGRWTVPGSWSGDFMMIRASNAPLALLRAAEAAV
ncbi:hypothetical protein ACO2Q3_02235 [Caulobacter sp. KR2-114]|uniref:hypothetical protein n=1 Tax=Caulobacter sp. KR2-114 TaxID=3400912 RepID=UPI003C10B7C1